VSAKNDLAKALDLLARTEDAEWNTEVKEFLLAHGYVERPSSRYAIDIRSFIPAVEAADA
jgi:hypothetical protein